MRLRLLARPGTRLTRSTPTASPSTGCHFWDYGGGILTDFCCHIVDLVHWAMDVDAPRTISAVGGRYALDDNGEVPDTPDVTYEYEKGPNKSS